VIENFTGVKLFAGSGTPVSPSLSLTTSAIADVVREREGDTGVVRMDVAGGLCLMQADTLLAKYQFTEVS